MCQSCSPFCGKCITPLLKSVKCSQCGFSSALTRDECIVYLGYRRLKDVKDEMKHGDESPHCEKCGADIYNDLVDAVVPQICSYSGITCGYPCGRFSRKRLVGDSLCMKQTPLRNLQTRAQKRAV